MPTNDLHDFARRIKFRAATVQKNTDTTIRKVAKAVGTALVMATPVDTGRARANWQASLDAPDTSTRPAPGSPGMGAEGAIARVATTAAAYRAGQVIIVRNNLPYIQRLNEGWSKQAPAGFVDTAVRMGAETVKNARITADGTD